MDERSLTKCPDKKWSGWREEQLWRTSSYTTLPLPRRWYVEVDCCVCVRVCIHVCAKESTCVCAFTCRFVCVFVPPTSHSPLPINTPTVIQVSTPTPLIRLSTPPPLLCFGRLRHHDYRAGIASLTSVIFPGNRLVASTSVIANIVANFTIVFPRRPTLSPLSILL